MKRNIITLFLALASVINLHAAITYELNGGVTNDYGWMSKSDMFQACMEDAGITTLASLEELKAAGETSLATICTPLGTAQCQAILDSEKWDWLEAYIMNHQNNEAGATALVEGAASAGWRYAIAAFFLEMKRGSWPVSADFSGAGKDELYIPAWKHAYANPTEIAEGEFVLNAPYKEGYTFDGWYATPDFSSAVVKTINASTSGTLYAKWKERIEDVVSVKDLSYADAFYMEDDGATYWEFQLYNMDESGESVLMPIVLLVVEAKSKTALNGTYDLLLALYGNTLDEETYEVDGVYNDETIAATLTIKNVNEEGNYSFVGSFVGKDGKTYKINTVTNVYAVDDTTGEKIELKEEGNSDPVTPPTNGTIVFDADVDQGNATTDLNMAAEYIITKNGITMTVSTGVLGTYNNEMHYRVYKNQTLSLTSTVGNIVKVEFTCIANNDEKYGPGCFTVDGGDYTYAGTVGTWTGSASEITFSNASNQVRATQVVVTIESAEIPETPENPEGVITCAQAVEICKATGETPTTETYTIHGYVTEIKTAYSEQYGNISFWMADTPDGGQVLLAYRVKPVNTADINVAVGDYVEVVGTLVNYSGKNPEVNAGGIFTIITPTAITYELNGGVTNDYGWLNKGDMFKACMEDAGITTLASLDELKSKGEASLATICTPLGTAQCQAILDSEKWDWLEAYIMNHQNADAAATVLTEGAASAGWRYAIAAFFLEMKRGSWPVSADFSGAGKDEAYIPAWKHAYANPTEIAEGEFVLNAPYKEGYSFAGWYATPDFSGNKVTTINTSTTGTLFAKWREDNGGIPTKDDLADFYEPGQLCVCVKFEEEVCNDIVFAGSYNGWNNGNPAAMAKFAPLEGFDGWYYVSVTDESKDIQGKPVQLKKDGSFSWDYQTGDPASWTIVSGTVNITAGVDGESDLTGYSTAEPVVLISKYFKNHNTPCTTEVYHDYTVRLTAPFCAGADGTYYDAAIIGSFNGWSGGVAGEIDAETFDYIFKFSDKEGGEFKFKALGDTDWSNQIQLKGEDGKWYDNTKVLLTAETEVYIDYSAGRYTLCVDDSDAPIRTEETATACDSYTWNGKTYTQSGIYTYTTTAANGNDSIVTLHLTISPTLYTEETISACDSYVWNDHTYTEGGTYTYTTTSVTGCDSIVTLHLTISQSDVGETEYATICHGETYTWNGQTYATEGEYSITLSNTNGCDSIVTLQLTILPEMLTSEEYATICYGETYTWNGQTYATTGAYTTPLSSVFGCDSTAILHLTVLPEVIRKTEYISAPTNKTVIWRGKEYNETGIFYDTVHFVVNPMCDSVIHMLDLTIADNIDSDKYCGDNLTWYYSNGALIITGSGDMYDNLDMLTYRDEPWYPARVTHVSLPDALTHISSVAFADCSNLTNIVIPKRVTSIGDGAFSWTGLQSVTIPASVTELGEQVFEACNNLHTIIYEGYPTVISNQTIHPLIGCVHLDTVIAPAALWHCTNADKALENRYGVPHKARYIEVTDGDLTNQAVKYIAQNTTALEVLDLTNTTNTTLPYGAFSHSYLLTQLYLPAYIETLPESMIEGGSRLSEITIPATVTEIGNYAFAGCVNIWRMTVEATTPPKVYENTFDGVNRSISVLVPAGSEQAYREAEYWREFFIDNTNSPLPISNCQKILREDQILILREGKVYTTMGQLINTEKE